MIIKIHGLKRIGGLAVIVAACLWMGPSALAQGKATRIGVVNMERVMSNSQLIRATVKQAEEQVQGRQDEYEKLTRDVQKQRTDLRTRQSVMSADQIEEATAKISALTTKANDLEHEINKDMDRVQRELMDPQVKKVMDAIRQIAAAESYDLILRSESVFYVSEASDITPLVIQELDKNARSGALNAPASATKTVPAPEKPASAEKPARDKPAPATKPKSGGN
jgi:outer membrane protein